MQVEKKFGPGANRAKRALVKARPIHNKVIGIGLCFFQRHLFVVGGFQDLFIFNGVAIQLLFRIGCWIILEFTFVEAFAS